MKQETLSNPRNANIALWGGIAFSVAFTVLIWWVDPLFKRFIIPPDQGPLWYEWQLADPTFWTRLSVWGLYALHQVTLWGLIYYAQTRVQKYSKGLHPVNLWALGVNALFIVLHLVQSVVWYDGLAQDTPIWSSQGSVILMLCAILLMENQRRGVFFGKKVPFSKRVVSFARKYHGYLFAWATVYTFWYHPMVNTPGHLIGFLYMFILLLQGSLFLTRVHVNKWWMLTQEVMVLVHGTVVAIFQGFDIWPMFAFGFAGIFVITQMHGLNLSRRVRWLIGLGYIAAAAVVYSGRGLAQLNELIRIPFIEYAVMFVMAALIWLGFWIADRIQSLKAPAKVEPTPIRVRIGQGDD